MHPSHNAINLMKDKPIFVHTIEGKNNNKKTILTLKALAWSATWGPSFLADPAISIPTTPRSANSLHKRATSIDHSKQRLASYLHDNLYDNSDLQVNAS